MVNSVPETILIVNQLDFTEGEDLYWEKVDLFDQQWIEQRFGNLSLFQLQSEAQNVVDKSADFMG
jgi:hypothetical protein